MTDTVAPQQLIFASRVNHSAVLNSDGERIGHIEDVAIEKHSGQVAYAVLSFGGFLGIGEKYHPVPWSLLTYDVARNAYVVALNKDELRAAPTYSREDLAAIGGTDEHIREPVYEYYRDYGLVSYW